ncbi:T9SS type A sorting domain-containing protein [Flavobacterium sp. 140616W15]|uniref:T9SS type A sorting domain-containing protein n=1 Tax=Flavobacterium sp. 140616W15 TaxID=2478552 RepID=UPI000F0C6155|nr:T9SS type A sorting domain-containing protein [Flavobacterium sp. 140616W15]AYN03114.1 T9SS C-terminal target domain-containing protein [Flavobacterium sp. 140616W15]
MKKKYFYYILLLLFNTSILFGQKVTLTPQVVNGKSYTSGPINLESTPTSSVSLGVTVEMPSIPGNNGTISIYSLNGLNANIVIGGNGGALFFGEGKFASRSFVVALSASDFNTSQGYIYAEYKTFSGLTYKSSNISVIKSGTTPPVIPPVIPPVTPPVTDPNFKNTLCCNQTIRYGDRPAPLVASTVDKLKTSTSWLKIIDSKFPNSTYTGINYSQDRSNVLITDYLTEPATFKRRIGSNFPFNDSNPINIKIIPTPIINKILIEGGNDTNGFVEIIDSNPKQIYSDRASARVNLNILENPYHVPLRGDTFATIDRYEWQYAITDQNDDFLVKNWITIENENSVFLEYTALTKIPKFEDNYLVIRRIAFYKNLSNASNILKIIPRTLKNNNVICCDQVLAMDSALQQIENPSLITGSSAAIEKTQNVQNINITYQWQSQAITNTRPNQYGTWSNITGATSKDYLPTPLQFIIGTRGGLIVETTYNYRRIATINYRINNKNYTSNSYSNETNVQAGRMYGTPTLIAYPNPASSIIYVENKSTDYLLSSTKISIANIMGTNVSANFSVINENLISIDVSNLVIGTYFINIENTGGDGRRGGRGNSQLTFIKTN